MTKIKTQNGLTVWTDNNGNCYLVRGACEHSNVIAAGYLASMLTLLNTHKE